MAEEMLDDIEEELSDGNETVLLSTLMPNENNPRKISKEAFKLLCESIQRDPEYMALRPIVVDTRGHILGGNQRYKACVALGMQVVPKAWVRVAKELTTEEKRRRFALVDNAPEGMTGEWDYEVLTAEWGDLDLIQLGFTEPDLPESDIAPDIAPAATDSPYTNKIPSVIYHPQEDEPPEISALYDDSKAEKLVADIKKASIKNRELEQFLICAAQRHIVFNYKQIAEFYAHATPEVQQLFEDSALVIIDFNKAIEDGYVKICAEIENLREQDYAE